MTHTRTYLAASFFTLALGAQNTSELNSLEKPSTCPFETVPVYVTYLDGELSSATIIPTSSADNLHVYLDNAGGLYAHSTFTPNSPDDFRVINELMHEQGCELYESLSTNSGFSAKALFANVLRTVSCNLPYGSMSMSPSPSSSFTSELGECSLFRDR